MFEVTSSNEYKVALSMYQDSMHILTKLLGEMYNYWEKRGYDIDIFYANQYKTIKIKNMDGKELDLTSISVFCKRFRLKNTKVSQTVEKDTMVGKYTQIIYYYFEGE